ncbi:diadenylate cyclase [Halomicroarcula sp. GCM10025324]|uniref:diadenylate cyclase n=1 Tax=Haloarcula TaxID=2237 RepID=UPI0023E8664E|nr:diadenylate cyclase [Halomicroarcula sp. ZS-22-S1]
MTDRSNLRAKYATSHELMDVIRYAAETLSVEFDRWDERHVTGPSLYVLIVADIDFGNYTDPLGLNTWPVDECQVVQRESDAFIEVARDVAFSRDGAIVVAGDGTIQEQMVRVRNLSVSERERTDGVSPAGWMGTKHLSALEASTRQQVLWAITLSEEDGRVTTFLDGEYRDYEHGELGGRWRLE